MSQQIKKILELYIVLLLLLPLGAAQENPTDRCIPERTETIGSFEQGNVQILIEPTQGQIDKEDIDVELYNEERRRTIPLNTTAQNEGDTYIFQPQNPYVPNGNYTLIASLDYGVWQPTDCKEFAVESDIPSPWITSPLPEGLEQSKIGVAKSEDDVFTLEASFPIQCVYRKQAPSQFYSDSNFENSNDKLTFGGEDTASISWQEIERIAEQNISSGSSVDMYYVCRNEVLSSDAFTVDVHEYQFKTSPPEIQSVTGNPSIIRDFNITPTIEVSADTPIYCVAYEEERPALTGELIEGVEFSRTTSFNALDFITPERTQDIRQNFVCTDLRGEEVTGNITIPVDLTEQLQWNQEPPRYIGEDNNPLPISVQAANLDTCVARVNQDGNQDLDLVTETDPEGFTVFNGSISMPRQGENNVTIECQGTNSRDETVSTQIEETVTYDVTSPSIEFQTPKHACSFPNIDYSLSEALDKHTSVEKVNITYTYRGRNQALKQLVKSEGGSNVTDFEIGDTYTEIIQNPTIEETAYTSGEIPFPERVQLEVAATPIDRVNNKGETRTKKILYFNPQDKECDNSAPSIGIEHEFFPKNNSDIIYGDIQCEDDKGCKETYRYSFTTSRSSANAASCSYTEVRNLDNDVVIDATADYLMLCAQVKDVAIPPNNDSLVREYEADSPGFCYTGNYSSLTGETDVDCGGPCPGCSFGKTCKSQNDCAKGLVCGSDNTCQEPPAFCSEGGFNPEGGETDDNCGGPCLACGTGSNCQNNSDCASGICQDDLTCAAPSCGDGILNQDEIYVDCGGPNCEDCPVSVGDVCQTDRDCQGKEFVCGSDNTCQLSPLHCRNDERDGDETDVDCGGSCQACEIDSFCVGNDDCLNNNCIDGVCAAPACGDGRLNNGETYLDEETGYTCGGPTCEPCTVGETCESNSDCATRNCNASNLCAPASCTNDKRDGDQTDVDCGGSSCDSCDMFQKCNSASDCTTGYCDTSGNTVSEYDDVEGTSYAQVQDNRADGVCFINPSGDEDEDGLPDYWEFIYSGERTGLSPEEDIDQDGFTNLEELNGETDPTDPTSHPERPETYTLNIILLVLGFISTSSGGGLLYYDRQLYHEEQARKRRRRQKQSKTKTKKKKKPKKKPKKRKSIMDKVKQQRDNILSSFNSSPNTKSKPKTHTKPPEPRIKKKAHKPKPKHTKSTKNQKHTNQKKKRKKTTQKEDSNQDYVDVNNIKNKDEYKDIQNIKKKPNKGEEDNDDEIFSELEELADE